MSNTPAPAFSRGGDAAEAGMKSASFSREVFLSLEDGEACYLRFLADGPDWISVDQYGFLPTKPQPEGWSGGWPKHMSAVSRADVNDRGEKTFAAFNYADDFIADFMRDKDNKPYKASKRCWAYVCMREEVVENGRIVGFRDKTREVSFEKDDGTTVTEIVKDIRICNLGWKNFFAPVNGFAKKFGTILNRDIWVKRKGSGQNDTTYEVVPMDPTPDWDLRNPEVAAAYPVEKPLDELVVYRTSDDYYARFFDTRVKYVPEGRGGTTAPSTPTPPAAQQARPETEVSDDRVSSLASRVMGYAVAPTEATAPMAADGSGLRNFNS